MGFYPGALEQYKEVVSQQNGDKNKIYTLHKPYTACIAKGKAHKQYEFGNKVGLMTTIGKRIVITAVDAFKGNPLDSNTIEPLLNQINRLKGFVPEEVVYDRGGRGKPEISGVKVTTPKPPPCWPLLDGI